MTTLRDLGYEQPKMTQLRNFLRSIRNKNTGGIHISLNDLKIWATERSEIPDDLDKVFVSAFEYKSIPEQKFRIFLTTKRLIGYTQHVILYYLLSYILIHKPINTLILI
jgi:hypothetical protein